MASLSDCGIHVRADLATVTSPHAVEYHLKSHWLFPQLGAMTDRQEICDFFSGGWGPPPPGGCPFGFGSERPGFALALVCSSFIRPPITPSLSVTAIFCPLQTGYKRPLRIDPDSYFRSGFSSGRPNPQPTARSSVPVSEGRTSWQSPGAPSDTVGLRPSSHRGGDAGGPRGGRAARLDSQASPALPRFSSCLRTCSGRFRRETTEPPRRGWDTRTPPGSPAGPGPTS